jgi:hypothetical protein
MCCAAALTCVALVVAILELRARRVRSGLTEAQRAAQAAADVQRG